MKITMDMSSYEIEQDDMECGEKRVSANWDPDGELVCGLQKMEASAKVSTAALQVGSRKRYSYPH